jgi:hypothetical protein
MTQYISKSALVAEIEKRIKEREEEEKKGWAYSRVKIVECEHILSNINSLEVKESKLPNPRFPHLNNIVDKVFGTGNLESLEYEEAEQLVLLAKEELLKDLEVREVDLEKELDSMITPELKLHKALPSLFDVAKHFFELGIRAQKGDNE